MGWCSEFGIEIRAGCDHAMVPTSDACQCEECGALCAGRFDGCAAVWQRGPQTAVALRPAPRRSSRSEGLDHRPDGRALEAISWLAGQSGTEAPRRNGRNGQPPESATVTTALRELNTKVAELRSALRNPSSRTAPRHLVSLAEKLPYRVAVTVANAVQNSEAHLEKVAEAVALVDETAKALRSASVNDPEAAD